MTQRKSFVSEGLPFLELLEGSNRKIDTRSSLLLLISDQVGLARPE
jgi:hypothetical protein